MKSLRTIVTLFALLCSLVGQGQQLPQFSQYVENPLLFNPAVTGSLQWVDFTLGTRQQWTGFDHAPSTSVLAVHSSIDKQKWGVGGYFFSDRNGLINNSGMNLSYAYHIPVGVSAKLGLGLAGSYSRYRFAVEQLQITHTADNLLQHGGSAQNWTPDASAGILLHRSDYFIGLSVLHLPETQNMLFNDFNPGGGMPGVRHYYAMGMYRYLYNEDYEVAPAFLAEYVPGAPVQFDVQVRAIYRDFVQFGLGYRYRDAMTVRFGCVFLRDWQVNYSYDFPVSSLVNYSNGSHEITLQYDLYYKPIYRKNRRRYNLSKVKKKDDTGE